MKEIILGSTGIQVVQNGFGALPVQRVSKEEGVTIMKEKQALSTKVYNAALDGLAETAEDTSDEGLARAFEEMYETWKNEYTVTTDPIWDNIVIGSVG